ncbi:MAG: DNA gyrase inhibitor YacG [Salinarimonas sp.]|nr:DNA gyrase inhibitor YacG [Salinarimonas sp.]
MSKKDTTDGTPRQQFTPRPCPICAKMSVERYRPFCSKRCADVDLQRWFTGSYAVPVVEEDRSPEDDDGFER